MTASEILSICVTVLVVQAFCDLVAYWRIYSKEPYTRAMEKRERALSRKERALKEAEDAKESSENAASSAKSGKKPTGKAARAAKALERAEQDLVDATSNVAYFSMSPSFLTALTFLIVMRVMGAENQGKIVGLLPFVPYSFVYRITGRGLDFGSAVLEAEEKADIRHVTQAFSFVFVYFLAGFSIKFYTNRLLGKQTPGGTDSLLNMSQSTGGKKLLRAVGIDPEEVKIE